MMERTAAAEPPMAKATADPAVDFAGLRRDFGDRAALVNVSAVPWYRRDTFLP